MIGEDGVEDEQEDVVADAVGVPHHEDGGPGTRAASGGATIRKNGKLTRF